MMSSTRVKYDLEAQMNYFNLTVVLSKKLMRKLYCKKNWLRQKSHQRPKETIALK
jgi:hypothetical protein